MSKRKRLKDSMKRVSFYPLLLMLFVWTVIIITITQLEVYVGKSHIKLQEKEKEEIFDAGIIFAIETIVERTHYTAEEIMKERKLKLKEL